jgi:hypothetical protein
MFTRSDPIEQIFAELKHLMRKTAARSRVAVCDAVAQIPIPFTPAECTD